MKTKMKTKSRAKLLALFGGAIMAAPVAVQASIQCLAGFCCYTNPCPLRSVVCSDKSCGYANQCTNCSLIDCGTLSCSC